MKRWHLHASRACALALGTAIALGCSSGPGGGSAGAAADDAVCRDAQARLGYRLCVEQVDSVATWTSIAAPSPARSARFLVPARPDARLPPLFEDDAAPSSNHFELLAQGFPQLFPGLTLDGYDALTTDPQHRELFGGTMTEYTRPDGTTAYGYRVWDDQLSAGTLTCSDAKAVHDALTKAFLLDPLFILPASNFQRERLPACGLAFDDPPVKG